MAVNLGVTFFIPFHELDPHQQSKCIFFTQKKQRCTWDCQEQDNSNARQLYDQIKNLPSTELPSLELLESYARYNCCGPKPKGARHQNRIEDIELLAPLAERWLEEITQRREAASDQGIADGSALAAEDENKVKSASLEPGASQAFSPLATTGHSEPFDLPVTATDPVLSPASSLYKSEEPPKSFPFGSESGQPVSRYDLRRRQVGESIKPVPRPPPSEFRPHVEEPNETVFSKLLSPLIKDDFKTGSLYIFNRASSPGYVKIGFTSRSVPDRLDDWSKCGYKPNLLFSVDDVPYANRAETLTHYELVAEWRAERRCKVCGKSHREWFEVSQERAIQVVSNWAAFLKLAKPYEENGPIKSSWREALDHMHKTNALITSSILIDYYETSARTKDGTEESQDVDKPLRVERLVDEFSPVPSSDQGEVNSLEVKQPSLVANAPLGFLPASNPVTSFTFEPQLSPPRRLSPTPPLQIPISSPESTLATKPESVGDGNAGTNTGLTTSPPFQFGTKFDFSYQTPPAKQHESGSERGVPFDFSYITPPADQPILGADTGSSFAFNIEPLKESPLRKERTFDFSYKTPPAEQSDPRTGREFDFSFSKPPATQPAPREGTAFNFIPSTFLAEQPNTKPNVAFDIPPATQSTPGTFAAFDMPFRPAPPTQSTSKTEETCDFQFGKLLLTQVASGRETVFNFNSNASLPELSTLGINKKSGFSFGIPSVHESASRANSTFKFGAQTSPTENSTSSIDTKPIFSFGKSQTNQFNPGPSSTFDFSSKAPPERT